MEPRVGNAFQPALRGDRDSGKCQDCLLYTSTLYFPLPHSLLQLPFRPNAAAFSSSYKKQCNRASTHNFVIRLPLRNYKRGIYVTARQAASADAAIAGAETVHRCRGGLFPHSHSKKEPCRQRNILNFIPPQKTTNRPAENVFPTTFSGSQMN